MDYIITMLSISTADMTKSKKECREDFKKFEDKGLTGLANLGNTCFMNSALACLSHTYELNLFLEKKDYKTKLNNKPESLILCEWDNLRELIWSENCTISPGGFVGAVQKVANIKDRVIFTGFAQNDLTEFLQFVTECFHESICREVDMTIQGSALNKTDKLAETCYKMMKNMYKKEYSEFLNIFWGIHVSQINSLESDYINSTPEPFFNLIVPISDKKDLTSCIELYTSVEKLDGDNKVYNEKESKKEEAEKYIHFWSLPDVLVITIKRFGNNNRKNQEMIDFPLTDLDMSPYVIGYDKNSYKYDLYGICNHSGGVSGGHYTSYVKNANNKWYVFNDTTCDEINLGALKTPKAYCFFYRKQKK
jgi:ubiquitin carboxyl-terminal hydrolase 8